MASNRRNTGLESTTALYKHVINEVCEKVQGEFINAGIDESVLHDLKWLWRRNVAKSQCCAHEQEAADEFAEFGFKIEELKPQQQQSESEDQDEQQKSKSQLQQAQDVDDDDDDLSPITDDEQPVEQQSQSTADQGTLQFLPLTSTKQQSISKRKRADDDDKKKSNDQPQSKKTLNTSKLDAQKQNLDEVDLGSDLDDSSDQEEEEVEKDHADDNNTLGQQSGNAAQSGNSSGVKKSKSQPAGLILCQYDKVTRSRNKWKTQLRDGVANVNGRDYVFSRAQLEFQF
ncbi:hypothetical protein MP228_003881 [Amoeboaphelidium protococcarum]|nr:hypothetical protein MP228_003881 [Amoeboaphelidium protococcarum]